MLQDNHKIISAETLTIIYKLNGVSHQYRPDFLVDDKIIYEIKDAKEQNSIVVQTKKEAAEAYCKQHNLQYKLLTNKDFRLLTRAQILNLFNQHEINFIAASLERFKKY